MTIDKVLQDNNMCRLKNFVYNVGDCLFDCFQILLHLRYTSTELRNGTIDHFIHCLNNNDPEALLSYNNELDPQALYELHGIASAEIYMQRMRLSAVPRLDSKEYGLWGDLFCIKWLSKWLNVQICVWSSTTKSKYLHFNEESQGNTYSILFHDENPICLKQQSFCFSINFNHCMTALCLIF